MSKKDWCTGWPDYKWGDCCYQHDIDYILQRNRKEADDRLRECVRRKGYPRWATMMYIAVRMVGWIFWWKDKIQQDHLERKYLSSK